MQADGYNLSGILIPATHDESAPDSLGLGGVDQTIWEAKFNGRTAQLDAQRAGSLPGTPLSP